jgi:hypothetical protein
MSEIKLENEMSFIIPSGSNKKEDITFNNNDGSRLSFLMVRGDAGLNGKSLVIKKKCEIEEAYFEIYFSQAGDNIALEITIDKLIYFNRLLITKGEYSFEFRNADNSIYNVAIESKIVLVFN